MVQRIRSSGKTLEKTIDVFEAVKRAMIRRGFIPKPTPRRTANSSDFQKPPQGKKSERSEDSRGKDTGELADVATQSDEILFRAETVFPFILFPDTISLDREKISIAERFFFRVAKITSVPVRDILSVEADVGPFFGSIKIASRYFITNPQTVNFLWRKDATSLRQLLQGYIIAHEREIDCSNIPKNELIKLLNDLGKGNLG